MGASTVCLAVLEGQQWRGWEREAMPIWVRRVRLVDEREAPGATATLQRDFRDTVEPAHLQNVIAKQRIKHY